MAARLPALRGLFDPAGASRPRGMHHSDYPHGGIVMKGVRLALVVVLSCACLQVAYAQRYPGRGGDHGTSSKRDSDSKPAAGPGLQEPFAALERELPSLTVDLQINAAQVQAWSVVERDVRDLAELDRVRKRHLLA